MLGAPFLAFVQVIVYTGAVLMLFLFVLMIVGISAADSIIETIRGQRLWAGAGRDRLLVLLGPGHRQRGDRPGRPPTAPSSATANVTALANLIFTRYLYPFEITSALLITAAVGAMVLAHRERTSPKPTQRDLAAPAGRQRPADPAAGPRHLRPAQRGRHARAAARRQPVRAVGQRGAHRAAPRAERAAARRPPDEAPRLSRTRIRSQVGGPAGPPARRRKQVTQ